MREGVASSELNDNLSLETCYVLQWGLDSLETASGGTLSPFTREFENNLKLLECPSRLTIYTEAFTQYCKYKNTQMHIYTGQHRYKHTGLEQKDSMHK